MIQGLCDTDICNSALSAVGGQAIQSLNDASNEARACKRTYTKCVNAMLRSHPWNFARVWLYLSQLAQGPPRMRMKPNPDGEGDIFFGHAYQLPADNIRVFRAAPYTAHWRIVGNQLYTDAVPNYGLPANFSGNQPGYTFPPVTGLTAPDRVGIEYISNAIATDQYDPAFVDALVARIASEIAFPVASDLQLKQSLWTEFQFKLNEAWYADGAEQWNDALYNNFLTDVRLSIDGEYW